MSLRTGGRPAAVPTGPGLLAAGAALWGTTGTSQALIAGALPSVAVGALRILIGGVALTVIAAPHLRAAVPALRSSPGPLLAAIVATAAYQPAFFIGVREAGVAVGTLVTVGAAPFLAGAIAALCGHHRPGRRWALTTLLAAGGLVLLVEPGGADRPTVGGIVAALLAALAFASYTVAAKRLLVAGVPRIPGLAVTFLAAGVLSLPALALALHDGADRSGPLAPSVVGIVLWLGLGATAAAYLLFTAGLRTVPAVTGATMALVEPVTAAALGVVVLGESLGGRGWLGAATVVIALLATALRPDADPVRRPEGPASPSPSTSRAGPAR